MELFFFCGFFCVFFLHFACVRVLETSVVLISTTVATCTPRLGTQLLLCRGRLCGGKEWEGYEPYTAMAVRDQHADQEHHHQQHYLRWLPRPHYRVPSQTVLQGSAVRSAWPTQIASCLLVVAITLIFTVPCDATTCPFVLSSLPPPPPAPVHLSRCVDLSLSLQLRDVRWD